MKRLISTFCLVLAATTVAPGDEPDDLLTVYVPRAVQVSAEALTLGDVCVIRGDDAESARKAQAVAIGRGPWSGEQLVMDRRTILGRLASVGIAPEAVRLTGAEEIRIRRNERTFSGEDLLAEAHRFLRGRKGGPEESAWKLVSAAKALTVRNVAGARLVASPGTDSPAGYLRVRVAVMDGRKELGGEELQFQLTYPARRAVARRDLARGEILDENNCRIETVMDTQPRTQWASPFGRAVNRPLKAGTVLSEALLAEVKREIVVRRNEVVTMKVQGVGYVVKALATAMQDGRPGEFIKVRNVDSKKIVLAMVRPDGTVDPLAKGTNE